LNIIFIGIAPRAPACKQTSWTRGARNLVPKKNNFPRHMHFGWERSIGKLAFHFWEAFALALFMITVVNKLPTTLTFL